jgi:puromycin-sensitive aminopeptidase
MARAYRLPENVRPKRYHVDLAAHPSRDAFDGRVTIDLSIHGPTDRIELHSKGLELSSAEIACAEGRIPASVAYDPDAETVAFTFERRVPAGAAVLTVDFAGTPNAGMHGLYLAKDGTERAVCTQCEATDARGIFPCFDEPEMKARIRFTIRSKADVIALANGPLEKTEQVGDEKVWHFSETDVISSYLAAFVIGDFEGTEVTRAGTTPIRVFAIRGKRAQAEFAHRLTERMFPYFERYFGVPYAYEKYDQVAVPGFDAGAMENVGLVLFRQNLLLMDRDSASWGQEKMIAKVIAHELAHMWFGNLVTMKWWDDLWLNEAFAEWFAHKAVHAVAPDYEVWADFQADKNRALIDDALPTTHPIYAPVETPGEAIEMFDVITYQKGCAVMRMLEHFLGEESFQSGIRTYMTAFARSNAAGKDLWAHLEAASQQPVGHLMQSWVEQPGFPILSVELAGTRLSLSQRRFFSSPAAAYVPSDQCWSVPVVVRYEDDRGSVDERFIFDAPSGVHDLAAVGEIRWCYANAGEIGFYRLDPRGAAAERLLPRVADALRPVEQMGFIEDQWALVRNASIEISPFMAVVAHLARTKDYNVVRALADRLGTLERMLEDLEEGDALTKLRNMVAELFEPHVEELGYEPREGEPQGTRQRRGTAIHAVASIARVSAHVAACERWAEKELADPRSVDPNLAGTFVGIAAKFGDAVLFDRWLETYIQRRSRGSAPQDSLRYLYTLAAFRPEKLVDRTLSSIDGGMIPQEAVGSILSQLLATRHGRLRAWAYCKGRWPTLRARIGDMGLARVVESVGHLPADHRADIVTFFAEHKPIGAERALARALESLDQREELYARVGPQLVRCLG